MPVHLPTPPPVETATIQPAADSTSAAKPIVIGVAEKLFSYKDGTITKINNLLPKPGIDDFYANAANFPKDTYNDLKKAIASTVWYSVTEDGKLLAKAEVVKWDGEDRILAKSLIPLVDNNESWTYPSAYYIWDGEKFVRDPEFKPLEQDLKVFGVTNKGGDY